MRTLTNPAVLARLVGRSNAESFYVGGMTGRHTVPCVARSRNRNRPWTLIPLAPTSAKSTALGSSRASSDSGATDCAERTTDCCVPVPLKPRVRLRVPEQSSLVLAGPCHSQSTHHCRPYDVHASGAQGHAHTQLVHPLAHRERYDSVNSNRGQQQRQGRKHRE